MYVYSYSNEALLDHLRGGSYDKSRVCKSSFNPIHLQISLYRTATWSPVADGESVRRSHDADRLIVIVNSIHLPCAPSFSHDQCGVEVGPKGCEMAGNHVMMEREVRLLLEHDDIRR